MNPFAHFTSIVEHALRDLASRGVIPHDLDMSRVVVEPPRDAAHGDVTTNAAMVLGKPSSKNPRGLAGEL